MLKVPDVKGSRCEKFSRLVPATCSRDLFPRLVLAFCFLRLVPAACSRGLFPQDVRATCSRDLFPRPAPATCSRGLFPRLVPAACSRDLQTQPNATQRSNATKCNPTQPNETNCNQIQKMRAGAPNFFGLVATPRNNVRRA